MGGKKADSIISALSRQSVCLTVTAHSFASIGATTEINGCRVKTASDSVVVRPSQ